MNGLGRQITIGLSLLFLTGCQKTEVKVDRPVRVAVAEVKPVSESQPMTFTGQVKARYELNSAFRVGGKVEARLVEVGQTIRAGAVLAKLEPTDFKLAWEAAKNDLEAAQAALQRTTAEEKRTRELVQKSMISPSEYELAKASAETSLATMQRMQRMVELAQNRLDYCTLRADYDCVVTKVLVEVGAVVQEGTPVFQLARLDELEVAIDLPENRMERAKSSEANMKLWSHPDREYSMRLREISPAADLITRTYQVRYSILQPDESIRLGMTATLRLPGQGDQDVMEVPASALWEDAGVSAVWCVVDSGRLEARHVTIVKYGQQSAYVKGDLKAGDRVIRAGVQKIQPNQTVAVWEESEAPASSLAAKPTFYPVGR